MNKDLSQMIDMRIWVLDHTARHRRIGTMKTHTLTFSNLRRKGLVDINKVDFNEIELNQAFPIEK